MPRSSIRDPSGTAKSAVTRISSSCSASLCGRKATRSLNGKSVRSRSSTTVATLVKTFSGRKMVDRCSSSFGTCDSMRGFHVPNSPASPWVSIKRKFRSCCPHAADYSQCNTAMGYAFLPQIFVMHSPPPATPMPTQYVQSSTTAQGALYSCDRQRRKFRRMSAESSIKASATISRTNIPPAAAPAEIFDPIYADLARLAAHVCQADFASIALNGTTAAWCSSTVRLAAAAAPQRDPFLEYALQSRELIEVADAAQDERVGADAFVIDGVGIRFYAGCALRIKDGSTVGVLAVYGTGPRQLTPAQRDALMLVVRQALVQAELRTRLLA